MANKTLYEIKIQKSEFKSVNDEGAITFDLSLSPDQLKGIKAGAQDILHVRSHRLYIVNKATRDEVTLTDMSTFVLRSNLLTFDPVVESWTQFIERQRELYGGMHVTKAYTCVLISIPVEGNMHNLPRATVRYTIRQFDGNPTDPSQSDFIQGVMSVCNWFDWDWRYRIRLLHHGDIPYTFEGIPYI